MASLADFRSQYPQYDNIPDDVLADALYNKFYSTMPREEFNKQIAVTPPPASTERTWKEALVTDPAAALISGGAQVLQLPGQLQRLVTGTGKPEEGLEGWGKRSENIAEQMKSSGLQVREQARSTKVADAEQEGGVSGILKSYGVAAWETIKDPALMSTILASQIPQLAVSGGVGTAVKGATAARLAAAGAAKDTIEKMALTAGLSADIATNALLQGADVGSDAYAETYKYLIARGTDVEVAHVTAVNKARQAAAAAAAISVGTQRLPGANRAERALLGEKGGEGFIRGALKTGAGESFTEGLEEGGGQLFKNLAVGQVDPNRQWSQGVGEAAGLGTAGGLGFGAPMGAIQGRSAALQAQQNETIGRLQQGIEQEQQTTSPLVVSTTAIKKDITPKIPETPKTPYTPEGLTAEEIIAKLGELIKDPSVDSSTVGSLREEYKKATGEVAPFPLVQAALARSKSTTAAPTDTYIAPDTSKWRTTSNVSTNTSIDDTGNQPSTGVSVSPETTAGEVTDVGAGALGGTEPLADKLNAGTVATSPALDKAVRTLASYKAGELEPLASLDRVVRKLVRDMGGVPPIFKKDTSNADRIKGSMNMLEALIQKAQPQVVTPVTETTAPAVEAPAVEAPAVEAPAVEAPAVEAPAVEAPAVEAPAVEAPAVEAPATPAVTPEAIKASRDKAALILKSNNLPRSKEVLDTFADESGVIDPQKVVNHVKTEKDKPKKQKDVLSQEEIDTKLDAISLDPDAKKTDVLRIAKQLADQGTIDQADLESLKRIAKDRDLTADDVRAELETTLRIKNEKGETRAQVELGTSGKVDAKFGTFTTIQQALDHVIKTGNTFEKLLAQRLRPFMVGVEYTVVTPDSLSRVPPPIQERLKNSRGVYTEFTGNVRTLAVKYNRIYIKSDAFGNSQGSNIKTVLHEALHAATVKKINIGLRQTDTAAARITNDLHNLMVEVGAAYKAREGNLGIPAIAFENIKEFVTYGMTDPALQEFMATLEGKKQSFFSRFVDNVRKFFGFGPQDQSAFMDLVALTDKLLSTRTSEAIQGVSTSETLQETVAASDDIADRLRKAPKDVGQRLSLLQELLQIRSKAEFSDLVGMMASQVPNSVRPKYLGALTLDQIKQVSSRLDPAVRDKIGTVLDSMRNMLGTRNSMLNTSAEIAKPWAVLVRTNASMARKLAQVMHLATVNSIDPATKEGYAASATLAAEWDALPDNAKDIYRKARDFYAKQFDTYQTLLEANIQKSKLDAEAKTKTIAALKKEFESTKVPMPYFPLMREGKYWFKSGVGKNIEYYMFESQLQRDLFVRKYFKDKGDNRKLDAIFSEKPGEYNQGNSYQQLYDSFGKSSQLLMQMMQAVDTSTTGNKDEIKDSIYQMYLMTLPERSFRKQFVHRKNTPGFSADALRNFARSSFRMSSQLSRLEYGTKILNTMDEMRAATEGNPEKPTLDTYIDEVADRVKYALNPEAQNGLGDTVANIANQFSFLWYLTSPASAVTNFSALPIFTLPVLMTRFNASSVKASVTMAGYAKKVFSVKGLKGADGSFTAPSLRNTMTDPEEIKAFEEFQRRGALDQTLVADMSGLSSTPSEDYTGTARMAMRAASFLFHSSEKLMREIAAMSAYKLARDQGSSPEVAVNRAMDAMYESLGDFSATGRARYLRGPVARVMFQFKSFSQMTTFYLVNNFYEMTKGATPAIKKEAATRLFGTLGMTGLFAGATGMPLYSVIMGAVETLRNALKDDDEPEIDMDLWFRNWLAETFNSKFLGAVVARGPVGVAMDIDLNSRIKLNDLWFRGVRQSKDEADWMRNFITDQLGPTVGLLLNTGEAARLFGEGNIERGAEKLMPALLKNLFVAERYNREGVKTLKGVSVFAEDELSKGDIFWQAFGFAPDRVADQIQANIAVKGMEAKIKGSRQHLLDAVTDDLRHGESEDLKDTIDKIIKFNSQYPTYAIPASTIQQSVKRRMENELMAKNGLQVVKPLRSVLEPMAEYARKE